MSKIRKSFGIIKDNSCIRIAELTIDEELVRIDNLECIETADEEETPTEDAPVDEALQSLDLDFDFENEAIPDIGDEEEEDTPQEIEEESDEVTPVEAPGTTAERKTFEDLAREMRFERGTISLNLDAANVTFKRLDIPPKISKRKLINETVKQTFPGTAPEVLNISHIPGSDGYRIGVVHEGSMDLLEQITSINRKVAKKSYHYSYIQANEFALINALRYNYSIGSEDISAIIYINKDLTQVFLTKGYDFFQDLPIINEGYQSKGIINTVTSRIMLESTHLGVSSIKNYFIAGEGLTDNMPEAIKTRYPDANAEFLYPARICEQMDYSERFDIKTLSAYIIPIMLATTAGLPKEPFLLRSNFLPKQLKEHQNIFSISVPGFIVLGMISVSALVGINAVFTAQSDNRAVRMDISRIQSQLEVRRTELDSIYSISDEITRIEKNIELIRQLTGNKNQWHYILERVSNNFRMRPLSWLTSLRNEGEDKFRLTGISNDRGNIVALSELFPEAVIHTITRDEIEDNLVWRFEISFSLPDPLETKRISYEREQRR